MRFEDQKLRLIEELKSQGIIDENVINSFQVINREYFVLPHLKSFAYKNQALPIKASQTISQPFIIALMMQILKLEASDKVLEIGTGSGYQTALIADIVDTVCTVERHAELTNSAKEHLKNYEYENIFFRTGDGTKGWERTFPTIKKFNKIIVSAGAPNISEFLKEQLEIGGILVVPVGGLTNQKLHVVLRHEDKYEIIEDSDCSFVPLIGEAGWEEK